MVLARVGGLLIAGTAAVGIWAIAFGGAAAAGPAGPGEPRSDSLFTTAFVLLLGVGTGAVGIAGHPPFASQSIRLGLVLVGVGLLGVAIGRTADLIPAGGNELQSIPYLILVFGGGLAAVVGSLVCGLSLARSPTAGPRIVGLAILAGPLSLPLALGISLALHVDSSVVVLIGLGLLILGYVGIGILALRTPAGDHRAPRPSSAKDQTASNEEET
jgi:hypothetical protein